MVQDRYGFGHLSVGCFLNSWNPLSLVESRAQRGRKRNDRKEYITGLLGEAEGLRCREIAQRKLIFLNFKTLNFTDLRLYGQ